MRSVINPGSNRKVDEVNVINLNDDTSVSCNNKVWLLYIITGSLYSGPDILHIIVLLYFCPQAEEDKRGDSIRGTVVLIRGPRVTRGESE